MLKESKIIARGIDTLYFGFEPSLMFAAVMNQHIENQATEPGGRDYEYRFKTAFGTVFWGKRHKDHCGAKFEKNGADTLLNSHVQVLNTWFSGPIKILRVDVYYDVNMQGFERSIIRHILGQEAAEEQCKWFDGQAGLETFYSKKGGKLLRVYDKYKECTDRKKAFIYPELAYIVEKQNRKIIRFEVQLRSQKLQEYERYHPCLSLPDVLEFAMKIVKYEYPPLSEFLEIVLKKAEKLPVVAKSNLVPVCPGGWAYLKEHPLVQSIVVSNLRRMTRVAEKLVLDFGKEAPYCVFTSGFRTKVYNRNIGGRERSWHTLGLAFDIFRSIRSKKWYDKKGQAFGIENEILILEKLDHYHFQPAHI